MARSGAVMMMMMTIVLAVMVASAAAARGVPAEEAEAVKRPDTLHEGTVLIPGIGRYELGSHYMPDVHGLDHSIPAAASGQFIPGADDTWVPNPGFEVPNPFRPGSSSP